MCGICGIVGTEPEFLSPKLELMLAALKHRGPDASGLWQRGEVALGTARLAIIDLTPAGNQPLTNEDGSLWISYNGEIYNFGELRQGLLRRGHRFASATDTEVIVHLYEEYGRDCVHHLQGMFAFALWDDRQKRLFLARDRLGVKPLYYAWDGRRLLFASELKGLLSSGMVSKELEAQAVIGYFSLGSVPPPHSIIRGVRALPPGHYLELQEGQLRLERYWELSFQPKEHLPPEAAAAQIGEMLSRSVRSHLVSDVPLGAFLSGGVDSSVIVALMRDFATGPLRTFNIVFPEAAYNESGFAQRVARRFETEHTEHTVTCADLQSQLTAIVQAMDQPTVDGVNSYFVSQVTRESGTIVALSGLGGDELFCGYSTFRAIPRLQRRLSLLRHVPVGLRQRLSGLLAWGPPGTRRQRLATLMATSFTAEEIYSVYRSYFADGGLGHLLNPGFCPVRGDGLALDYVRELGKRCDSTEDVDRVSFLELMGYMSSQLLRDTDAMSMAHSLEVRVPFLDHTLVEFVSRLPGELRAPQAPKQLLLQALGHRLPPEVVERGKQGFDFPFDPWLRHGLKPLVSETFSPENVRRTGVLQPQAVHSLWRSFLDGGNIHWSCVWIPFVFQLWCQQVLR